MSRHSHLPASDADKWFLSIVTTRGCKACEQLKQDWAKDPWLPGAGRSVGPPTNPGPTTTSTREDQSQAFRFEGIQIAAYPTVILQPPGHGKYGDSKTVVFQGVYGGSPQKLAEAIAQAIRQYVGRRSEVAAAAAEGTRSIAAARPALAARSEGRLATASAARCGAA